MLNFAHSRALGRMLAVGFAALALSACVTYKLSDPTRIDSVSGDQQLDEARHRVSFEGNSRTARETVEDYLLVRAAETTLGVGREFFQVLDHEVDAEVRYQSIMSGDRHGFGSFSYHHRFYWDGADATSTSRTFTRYRAFADILVLETRPPAAIGSAYDARAVIERLGPTAARLESTSS